MFVRSVKYLPATLLGLDELTDIKPWLHSTEAWVRVVKLQLFMEFLLNATQSCTSQRKVT